MLDCSTIGYSSYIQVIPHVVPHVSQPAEVYRGTMYDGTEVAIKVGGLGELALRSMKIMKPKRIIRKLGLFANYPVVRRVGMNIFPLEDGESVGAAN